MEVNFYINTSPTIKVNKSLTSIKTVQVDIPDSVDVVNPVLIIDNTSIPSEANYMTCGAPLSRKYFIVAMDYTNAKRVIVAGHVDVLSTYHGFLENTTLNYVGGADKINEIEDGSYPLGDALKVDTFRFKNWDATFFTNSAEGQRYLLRIADGATRPRLEIEVEIGSQILYKNKLFTLEGSWNAAYLSTPTEIPLPPSQPYAQVADGTEFTILSGSTAPIYAQLYEFRVLDEGIGSYSMIAVN